MAEAEVKPTAFEGVLKRLDEFVKPFAASLKHDAQRQHAAEYVAGLVSNVKRRNIETIAYLHEQDRQPMQKFIGQRPWDEGPMIDELVRQVAASIGRADGVLVIDPSGVLRARQGVGRRGAAVVRASGKGGQLPGRRLYGLRLSRRTGIGRCEVVLAQR